MRADEGTRPYGGMLKPVPGAARRVVAPYTGSLWNMRAAKGRPYRTCKRLSGEYRRGRSQTGPPSMGKFPGYGGRGTPQGGLSRPSADSPSASALRDSKKRIQSRNRSALSHRAKLCQTARRGRRALHGALSVGPDDPAGRGKRNACVIRAVSLIRHGFAVPPSPLEGEGYLYRERWLGKLRRRSGTAPKADFANTGPLWARKNRTQALLILRAGNDLLLSGERPS